MSFVYSNDGLSKVGIRSCECSGKFFKSGLKSVWKKCKIVTESGKPKFRHKYLVYFYSELNYEHTEDCYRRISWLDKSNRRNELNARHLKLNPTKIEIKLPSCEGTCCGSHSKIRENYEPIII